jgi:hypothetical protein
MKNDTLLLKVAKLSMIVCRRHLAAYSCAKSKHDFTQPQLMTCVVLKTYLKQTFRGVCDILAASDALREAMGLEKIPHYSSLKKFGDRCVSPDLIDGILGTILREVGVDPGEPAAIDSTGMDPRSASSHFRAKTDKAVRGKTDKIGRENDGYVKVSVIVTCVSKLAVATTATWGPAADLRETPTLLARAYKRIRPSTLYGDRGYDAEWVHRWCRMRWHVRSVIAPMIRSADGSIKTHWRRQMLPLPRDRGRRWAVESFFSGLKRSCGDRLVTRSKPAQLREATLRVLAYTLRR